MDKLDAMNAFVKVVATGSFAEAGRQLGLTRSAVSKAVMELEAILAARLLDRTTRRVSPTEAGLAYYERCLSILADVEDTEAQISRLHDEPRGVLKINAPTSFGTLYLAETVAAFMQDFPDMTIEMTLNDRFIDPIADGVDVTIRIGELADSSLIARRLAPARIVLSAAPRYLEEHGAPTEPAALSRHQCLTYGYSTTLQRWRLRDGDQQISVEVTSRLCCNNGEILCAAAIAGHGIACLPTFIVGPAIAAGDLQIVLPEYPPHDLAISALYAPNRYLAAKTRVFIDFLVARFGENPPWDRA